MLLPQTPVPQPKNKIGLVLACAATSADGACLARDTMLETCRKLGLSFWQYLGDRIGLEGRLFRRWLPWRSKSLGVPPLRSGTGTSSAHGMIRIATRFAHQKWHGHQICGFNFVDSNRKMSYAR